MSGALLQASAPLLVIDFNPINANDIDSAPVTSGFRFNSDGTIDENQSGAYNQIGVWASGAPRSGIGSGYEVRALSTGKVGTWTTAAAADDTWTSLSSNKEWNVVMASSTGTKTTSATFEIRKAAGGNVLDSETCEAEAQAIL